MRLATGVFQYQIAEEGEARANQDTQTPFNEVSHDGIKDFGDKKSNSAYGFAASPIRLKVTASPNDATNCNAGDNKNQQKPANKFCFTAHFST